MFAEIRRKDKAKTTEDAQRILKQAPYGVVATTLENGYPYAVPVSHIYEDNAIYFHSANAGQKFEALLRNPKVSFTVMGGSPQVQPGKFTVFYSSAIAFGTVSVVQDEAEEKRALHLITQKFDPGVSLQDEATYTQSHRGKFCVFRITIQHLTAKGLLTENE